MSKDIIQPGEIKGSRPEEVQFDFDFDLEDCRILMGRVGEEGLDNKRSSPGVYLLMGLRLNSEIFNSQ